MSKTVPNLFWTAVLPGKMKLELPFGKITNGTIHVLVQIWTFKKGSAWSTMHSHKKCLIKLTKAIPKEWLFSLSRSPSTTSLLYLLVFKAYIKAKSVQQELY